jgi:hypothetical protein
MAQQQLSSDEMYGIAKKINRELEQFPMHTHSAIVEMVRVGMQHRNLGMQADVQAKQQEQQERMLKMQEQQQQAQLAQMAAQREAASRIKLVGKTDEPAAAAEPVPEPEEVVQ